MFFALTCDDGHVMILQFTGPVRDISETELSNEIAKGNFGRTVVAARKIDPRELPQSRRFRNAWRDGGLKAGIVHDLATAKAILTEETRFSANAASKALDGELLGALARNDGSHRQLIARQRALAAAPDDPRIAAAASIAELEALDVLSAATARMAEEGVSADAASLDKSP